MPMLSAALVIVLASPSAAEEPAFPQRVDEVELRGLWRTEPAILLRELPFAAGAEVDEPSWQLAKARLWNTQLLSRMDARIERRGERQVLVYEVEEKFTLNPLFRFQTGGGTGWLRLGLDDINLLGRFIELGGQYERFGAFNGGQAWVRDPRLFGKRLDGQLLVESLFRPRPGFDVRQSDVRLDLFAETDDRLRVGGSLTAFADGIYPAADSLGAPPDSRGLSVSPLLRLGRVDTERLLQRGLSLELRPALFLTSDPNRPHFLQLAATALGFAAPAGWLNLTLRLTAAASGAAPRQHLLFLGGLDLLRGFPDNAFETDLYAALNAELRATAFDSTWLAIVAALFVDAAAVRAPEGARFPASAGFGLRFLIPRLLQVGLRADLAFPLDGKFAPSPSLGVYQFF